MSEPEKPSRTGQAHRPIRLLHEAGELVQEKGVRPFKRDKEAQRGRTPGFTAEVTLNRGKTPYWTRIKCVGCK